VQRYIVYATTALTGTILFQL